jgi:5'-nucleotidase
LVDVIAAGHTHGEIAHLVDGIGIIQPFSRGGSFGRVDVVFDRRTRHVARIQPLAPQQIVPAQYEGKAVANDPAVVQAMAPALKRVHELQATPLGVSLDAPIPRAGTSGSALGNLFAAALREAVPGADVAAINSAARGLRADLAAGPLTVGRLYEVFPFDNRVARITLSGAELARWVAGEMRQGRRGSLGISGVEVRASCLAGGVHVDLFRGTVRIHDDDRLLAVTIGGPTLSGNLASADPVAGAGPIDDAPVAREVFEDWFRRLGHDAQRELDAAAHRSPAFDDAPINDCVAR